MGQRNLELAAHIGHIREFAGVGALDGGVAALGANFGAEFLIDLHVYLARELANQLAKELGGHDGHALVHHHGVHPGADDHFAIGAGQADAIVYGFNQHALEDGARGAGAERVAYQAHACVDIGCVGGEMHV